MPASIEQVVQAGLGEGLDGEIGFTALGPGARPEAE